jgi:hypothetical protein
MKLEPAEKDGNPVAVQIKMAFDCADELTGLVLLLFSQDVDLWESRF